MTLGKKSTQKWISMTLSFWEKIDKERERRGYRRYNDFMLHLMDLGFKASKKMPATPVTTDENEE